MLKTLGIAFVCAGCLGIPLAGAQERSPPPFGSDDGTPRALLNQNYLTTSGATVPNPGRSQSSGNTALDRRISGKDDAAQRSICSNC